jgi:hypothetical protein
MHNHVPDIQDYLKSALLLCSSKYTDQSNCALEVVINIKDENVEQISENFFLYSKPLPISRIKTVYFKNEEQKAISLFSVEGGAAFLPENIIEVLDENEIHVSELPQTESADIAVDYTNLVDKYDKIMGGFAMINIARDSEQNYSTHFFSTLGNVNSHFTDLLTRQNVQIENTYHFIFEENSKFASFNKILFSEINLEIVQEFAKKDGVKIETKNGVIQSEKILIDTKTYILSFLENFGNGKRKQLDSFVSELMNGNIPERKKEGISFVFGINKGYKSFRNSYKTSNFEIDIKFHLDSLLDYYIIESIYQFVFNKKTKSVNFDYIDAFQDKIKHKSTGGLKNNSYQILDKHITYKKKVASSEDYSPSFLEARSILFDKITETLSSILPSFLNIDKEILFNYLHEHFDQAFKASIDLLSKDIQDELKHNEKYIFELKSNQISKDKEIENLEAEIINLKKSKNELAEELENIKSTSHLNNRTSNNSPSDYSKNEDGSSNAVNENTQETNNYSQENEPSGPEISKKTSKDKNPTDIRVSKRKLNYSKEEYSDLENTDATVEDNNDEQSSETIVFNDKENSFKTNVVNNVNSIQKEKKSIDYNHPNESKTEEATIDENSSDSHDKNARAQELSKLTLGEVKKIAKNLLIKVSKNDLHELIKEIVRIEFKS